MTRAVADALVLRRPRDLVRRSLPLPDAGADDGILRVEACGLCGTDHERSSGDITAPYGRRGDAHAPGFDPDLVVDKELRVRPVHAVFVP